MRARILWGLTGIVLGCHAAVPGSHGDDASVSVVADGANAADDANATDDAHAADDLPLTDGGAPDQTVACGPTAGGPYWVEEGATVSAVVACGTGRAASGNTFTLGALPRGAVYNPATATLSWKPGLDQAGVYVIPITATAYDEGGSIKIGVADKFDDPNNVPIADRTKYTEEFGLPVFHLHPTPELDANLPLLLTSAPTVDVCNQPCGPDFYTPIEMTYRGHTYAAEGHYRGASSLNYPKRNYTLRFAKSDRFSEPVLAGGRIVNRKHINLITTFDDNSYVRWRMALRLWNAVDPNIIRIEHYSAVVYLDGQYLGLYAVSDKIDDDMLGRNGLAKDGNLYMSVTHDGNFEVLAPDAVMPEPRKCPFQGFTKKNGLPDQCDGTMFVPSAFDDLLPFVDFLTNADDTKFNAGVGQLLQLGDYIGWFIHATAIRANDSYEKNAYHYHDPVGGGPWRVVMWDYNDSFGQAWNSFRMPASGDLAVGVPGPYKAPGVEYVVTNNLWTRMWKDSTVGPQIRARYASVLKNELKLSDVLAAFDATVQEIAPSAKRDERKWSAIYKMYYGGRTDFTTYAQEIVYMRRWITDRWQYLQSLYP